MKRERINIKIDVNNKNILFNKFNNEVLSQELKLYLDDQLVGESSDGKVSIIVSYKDISKDDIELFKATLKKEYREIVKNYTIEKTENNLKKYLFFFLGIIFITCSYLLDSSLSHIVAQVIMVFGWVSMWEVASSILFDGSSSKLKVKRAKQILNATIIFKKEN